MNILLIILALVFIWRCVEGFKAGMVREIISLFSLVVASVTLMLLGSALQSYVHKEISKFIVAVILLIILGVFYRILKMVLSSIKLIAKLPVIHLADRIMGGIVGAAETAVVLWIVFFAVMQWGMGMLGQQIIIMVKQSTVLTWFYEHNYLAYWIEMHGMKLIEKL